MRSLKVDPATELILRHQILEYFTTVRGVYWMKHEPPFVNDMQAGRYDWDQVRFVRRSLEVAGLLVRVGGTTSDVELMTTRLGIAALADVSAEEQE